MKGVVSNNSAFCCHFGVLNAGFIFLLFGAPLTHADDNVYMSDTGAGTITQINPSGSASIFASGLDSPEGLVFDSAGNLYVADSGDGTISKIDPTGNVSTFASGLNSPAGLAFDSNGNLYVATPGSQTILKINPSGNVSVFATGVAFNSGGAYLTTDKAGNVYVNSDSGSEIDEFNSTGNIISTIGGPEGINGMAVDSAGNVYWCKTQAAVIYGNNLNTGYASLPAPYNNPQILGAEFDTPESLALDASGNLYVSFGAITYGFSDGEYENPLYDHGVVIEFGANGDNRVVTANVNNGEGGEYIAVQSVPEPATWAIFSGLAAVLCLGRRSNRKPGRFP